MLLLLGCLPWCEGSYPSAGDTPASPSSALGGGRGVCSNGRIDHFPGPSWWPSWPLKHTGGHSFLGIQTHTWISLFWLLEEPVQQQRRRLSCYCSPTFYFITEISSISQTGWSLRSIGVFVGNHN